MIEVENLSFSYNKKTPTLQELSFVVPKGQWVSIIGHNGSGKSTLSKLLNGLLEADSGEIKIDSLKLNKANVNIIRKKVGIVFQNPDNQFVGVSVKHDIAFGLENRRIEREEMSRLIVEYAQKVNMDKFLDAEPSKLSGGQKQRVAIAGVLAVNPDIIIFDEATSMLDPEGTQDIIKLIKALKGKKTIITITHDLDFACLSDRILVLKEGRIILDNSPQEVFKNIDILLEARLDIPFKLKLHQAILNSDKLKNNEGIKKIIWESDL